MQARGPVFGTMFNPVCMILVAMSGYFFLDEQQFLGRVIGALIICSGLYFVAWGTDKDRKLRLQAQENANAVANP
ncbi:WAT1-related protein [Trifolium medium]|uniref:WAT1-related protein n=1 Tax=Trifolium medium TaxID=97028 RepID=A0A392MY34_9FABA|nr:WAT1-related protein [Trifolium medium]